MAKGLSKAEREYLKALKQGPEAARKLRMSAQREQEALEAATYQAALLSDIHRARAKRLEAQARATAQRAKEAEERAVIEAAQKPKPKPKPKKKKTAKKKPTEKKPAFPDWVPIVVAWGGSVEDAGDELGGRVIDSRGIVYLGEFEKDILDADARDDRSWIRMGLRMSKRDESEVNAYEWARGRYQNFGAKDWIRWTAPIPFWKRRGRRELFNLVRSWEHDSRNRGEQGEQVGWIVDLFQSHDGNKPWQLETDSEHLEDNDDDYDA